MIKVGDEFTFEKVKYLVLDIIDLGDKKYVLFSTEKKKRSYEFYEIIPVENGEYDLIHVEDDDLRSFLFTIEKERIAEEK